jgi:hypothetical protein
MAEYDIDRRHGAHVFVDASNPSFIRSLKAGIPGEDVDYERLIDSVKRNVKHANVVDLQYLAHFMTVIPVPFSKYHKQMLGHTREILEYGGGCVAIRPYIANWYNKAFLPGFNEFKKEHEDGVKKVYDVHSNLIESEGEIGVTTKYLAEYTQNIFGGMKPSRDDIREQYLEPLYNLGVIDKAKSTINKNENVYRPVDETGTGNLFSMVDENNPDDFRLKIKEPSIYPSKSLLLNSIRTFVKHRADDGTCKLFQKYRLEDPAGNEITVQELIDRYLGNPEICFRKEYRPDEEQTEESRQKTVRPILNNIGMYDLLRGALQQFSNNNTEESSTSEVTAIAVEIKPESRQQRTYSDFLVDGIPLWQIENRGKTPEEDAAYKQEIEKLKEERKSSKLAEMAAANESGNGVMFGSKGEADI